MNIPSLPSRPPSTHYHFPSQSQPTKLAAAPLSSLHTGTIHEENTSTQDSIINQTKTKIDSNNNKKHKQRRPAIFVDYRNTGNK